MSERFYINCSLAVGPITVTGAEARHMAAVCRLRPNDPVCLFDGSGQQFPARVVSVDRRAVTLDVLAVEQPVRELPFAVAVAAPLPRGDRAQFLVEKLTELGIARYIPLRTRRSVVHPGDARRDRLERWVIEACKQCGRNTLMAINPVTDWADLCRRPDLPSLRILADPRGEPIASVSFRQPALLAVGPEGGFTEEEIQAGAGWQRVSLGPRILRVETAALVLAARSALE